MPGTKPCCILGPTSPIPVMFARQVAPTHILILPLLCLALSELTLSTWPATFYRMWTSVLGSNQTLLPYNSSQWAKLWEYVMSYDLSMSACELSHGVFAAVHFFSLECFGCFTRAHEAQRTETVPLTRQILDVSPKSPFPPPLICPVLLFFFFLRGSLSFSLFLFSLKPVVLEFSSKHESNTHLCISSTRSSWPTSVRKCLHGELSDWSSGCRQCLQQAPLLLLHAVKWTPSNQLPSQQHSLLVLCLQRKTCSKLSYYVKLVLDDQLSDCNAIRKRGTKSVRTNLKVFFCCCFFWKSC